MNILILAAGKGTRMKSALPKVLHPVGGQSMLCRVVGTALQFENPHVVVVVGHGAQAVQQHLSHQSGILFASQSDQLGTGHAVQCAIPALADHPVTLILYGDVPLIQFESLQPLVQAAKAGQMGLMTLHMPNPNGYGRIIRDTEGAVVGIVEQKDATPSQLTITEVNTGILACPTAQLKNWVGKLSNNNAQGEYYLTDIIAMAHEDGLLVRTCQPTHSWEVSGVNSRVQQAELERIWQLHQAEELMIEGVQLLDPARIDLRGTLHCGADVSIDVGCVFSRSGHLGRWGVRRPILRAQQRQYCGGYPYRSLFPSHRCHRGRKGGHWSLRASAPWCQIGQ